MNWLNGNSGDTAISRRLSNDPPDLLHSRNYSSSKVTTAKIARYYVINDVRAPVSLTGGCILEKILIQLTAVGDDECVRVKFDCNEHIARPESVRVENLPPELIAVAVAVQIRRQQHVDFVQFVRALYDDLLPMLLNLLDLSGRQRLRIVRYHTG